MSITQVLGELGENLGTLYRKRNKCQTKGRSHELAIARVAEPITGLNVASEHNAGPSIMGYRVGTAQGAALGGKHEHGNHAPKKYVLKSLCIYKYCFSLTINSEDLSRRTGPLGLALRLKILIRDRQGESH
jgi:hypothetical protein